MYSKCGFIYVYFTIGVNMFIWFYSYKMHGTYNACKRICYLLSSVKTPSDKYFYLTKYLFHRMNR